MSDEPKRTDTQHGPSESLEILHRAHQIRKKAQKQAPQAEPAFTLKIDGVDLIILVAIVLSTIMMSTAFLRLI